MERGTQNVIKRPELPINHGSAPLFKDHKMSEVISLTRWGRRGLTACDWEAESLDFKSLVDSSPASLFGTKHGITSLHLIFLLCKPESVARVSPPHCSRSGSLVSNRYTPKFQNGNSTFTNTAVYPGVHLGLTTALGSLWRSVPTGWPNYVAMQEELQAAVASPLQPKIKDYQGQRCL